MLKIARDRGPILYMCLLACLIWLSHALSCNTADRYCGGAGGTEFVGGKPGTTPYMSVDTVYDWELFEGSIPLTQTALVWKEISDDDNVQQRITSSRSTKEVIRIREVHSLANPDTNYVYQGWTADQNK